MCGIAGTINGQIRIVKSLLLAMEARGEDSLGIVVINEDLNLLARFRAIGPAHKQIFSQPLNDVVNNHEKKIIIGHTRAATIGSVKLENAHPFNYQNVVGCHNGTLDSVKGMPKHEVDSQSLLHSISLYGSNVTLNKVVGCYILVWYNKVNKTLNLARGGDRPLHYTWINNQFYYASTAEALRSTLVASKIKYKKIHSLNDGEHIVLDSSGQLINRLYHPIPKRSIKKRFLFWIRSLI